MAVHDAHAAGGRHHSAVEELVDGVPRLLGALPDDVDLLCTGASSGAGL